MIKNLGRKIAESINITINQCKNSPLLRLNLHDNSFTRDRILKAAQVVSMIVCPAKQSLQARLHEFGIKFMKGVYVTKQAFSKQRQLVNPDFIRDLYDGSVDELIHEGELQTFKGMHLVAVDGMRISCENTPELKAEFGCSGPNKDACTALASAAYDIIEHVSYDCQIDSYSRSERYLLYKHLDRLENFKNEKFSVVGDRGYPSYDLMESMIDRGFSFILRFGENWKYYTSRMSSKDDRVFEHKYKGKTYNIRVLKIKLDDKFEYLVTDLNREILTLDEAKYIYSLRWNIETFFSFVKTELELENFSGKTKVSVMQEFYATMTIANICLCFINDADKTIAAKQDSSTRIHEHQANRRQCVGEIVPKFLECIQTDSNYKRNRLWKEVEQFCERFSEPIRPGRCPERKIPRNKKFYTNARKPNLS